MTSSANKKSSKRTYGGLSEEERVRERRDKFLEAGLEVFGTLGLRGATVRKLCKQAGLTERYFYESFADTDDLYCAVYQTQLGALASFFLEAFPSLPTDLEGRIRAALDLYFTRMRDARLVRVLYIESLAGSDKIQQALHANVDAQAVAAAALIRADNPDLQFDDQVGKAMALAINGSVYTVAVHWMLSGYEIPQATLVDGCTQVVQGTMQVLKSKYAS